MLDSATAQEKEILRRQTFSLEQPGTVLRDFEMLLAFVGSEGVKVGGKYHLLPQIALPVLNLQLARPLQLTLERLQLRSNPYLQGLYLLLCASRLGVIVGQGEETRVCLDPELLAGWRKLNHTEQYCNLLEAWLRFGRDEMVGDDKTSASQLTACAEALGSIKPNGQVFDLKRTKLVFVRGIHRRFFKLALLDLFGLVQVDFFSEPIKSWIPAGIKHRLFGDVLIKTLFYEQFFGRGLPREEEIEGPGRLGVWQSLLKTYFPQWRNNLHWTMPTTKKGQFVFKISLGRIWRRIAISADLTLDDLASGIISSVKFDSDHLYEFTYRDRNGTTVRALHPACNERPYTDEITVGTLPLEPGQSMKFIYDFGDWWTFAVKLEKIDTETRARRGMALLGAGGKAPEQYPNY